MKIIKNKKEVQISSDSWKEAREKLKPLIKIVRDNCFQWQSFLTVIFHDTSFKPIRTYQLDPESMMLGTVCVFSNKILCECDQTGKIQKKRMDSLGRNCGFYECLNPEHIFTYDVDDLADDILNGIPLEALQDKYGTSLAEIKHFKRDLDDDFNR